MALLKGKLYGGLLFAGLLLGGQGEQIPVTPSVPSGGMIARGVQYAQSPAKHVQLSGKTWQEQDTYGYAGIKYDLIAQHKVFALGKTGQEQVSVGSITSTNLVNVYKTDKLVSAHYQLNVATAQNQESSGYANTLNAIAISDVPEVGFGNISANLVIGLQETSQVQQTVGKIISKQPIVEVQLVSTHLHANVITVQVQESHGSVSTKKQVQSQVALTTISAKTSQQQVSFGKVTTDDNEMLMVLMALLALDEEVA